jgi:hypothetical protein
MWASKAKQLRTDVVRESELPVATGLQLIGLRRDMYDDEGQPEYTNHRRHRRWFE